MSAIGPKLVDELSLNSLRAPASFRRLFRVDLSHASDKRLPTDLFPNAAMTVCGEQCLGIISGCAVSDPIRTKRLPRRSSAPASPTFGDRAAADRLDVAHHVERLAVVARMVTIEFGVTPCLSRPWGCNFNGVETPRHSVVYYRQINPSKLSPAISSTDGISIASQKRIGSSEYCRKTVIF